MAKRGRGGDLTNSPLGPVLRFVALLYLRAHMHEFLPRRMSVPNKIHLMVMNGMDSLAAVTISSHIRVIYLTPLCAQSLW